MSDGNVLHVMRTAGVSGAERHLEILVRHLRDEGWTSEILLASPTPDALAGFARRLDAAGTPTVVIPAPRDASVGLLRRLRGALHNSRHDLIHTHLVHADWHAGLAAALGGRNHVPLVSTKHNHDRFRTKPPFQLVEGLFSRHVAATIAISDSLAGFLRGNGGRSPVTVLYGLPAGTQSPLPRQPREVPVLLSVGRLEPQKGFDVLIDAMASLIADGRAAHLRIAGAGSLEQVLARQIEERGLGETVELLGQRDDVPALMRDADLLVHPARWEGFGLVLLEAMREGLPVLATRTGAIPEVVDDGVTGKLVASEDPAALSAGLAEMLDQRAHLAEMGLRGRERLTSIFTPERMARETAAVYASARR